jgi:large subunit ribosomal protein L29
MFKANDLRERTVEDLRELEKTLSKDIFQARFKNFTNRLDDTSSVRKTRRDLARVKTVISQKLTGALPAKPAETAAKPVETAAKPAKKPAAKKATAKTTAKTVEKTAEKKS